MNSKQPRFFRASAIAPLPAVALVILVCALGFAVFDSASGDDAPARAAVAILLLSPLWYLVLSAALYLVGRLLWFRHLLSLKWLNVAWCAVAVGFGVFVAWRTSLGLVDAALSLVTFAFIAVAFLLPTVFFWWRLARVAP